MANELLNGAQLARPDISQCLRPSAVDDMFLVLRRQATLQHDILIIFKLSCCHHYSFVLTYEVVLQQDDIFIIVMFNECAVVALRSSVTMMTSVGADSAGNALTRFLFYHQHVGCVLCHCHFCWFHVAAGAASAIVTASPLPPFLASLTFSSLSSSSSYSSPPSSSSTWSSFLSTTSFSS